MARVVFFMMVSANGFYTRGRADTSGPPSGDDWQDIDWHNVDAEFNAFALEQLETAGTLLFGRVTYQGMADYWPTPAALAESPVIAEKMNALPKLVFSRTLERADWNNTRLVRGDPAEAIRELKRQPGKDAFVMGSSDLAASLAERGLIDEYRIMVNPIALADGKPVLKGLRGDLRLKLRQVKTFDSGNVLLYYEPQRAP